MQNVHTYRNTFRYSLTSHNNFLSILSKEPQCLFERLICLNSESDTSLTDSLCHSHLRALIGKRKIKGGEKTFKKVKQIKIEIISAVA